MEMNGVQRLEHGHIGAGGQTTGSAGASGDQPVFEDLLQQRAKEGLNFSKHAARRMAVISAQGVFIVNVPNNTVVTTMSQSDMKERVFTNIDSAVLM